jgi:hypothetical protein
MRIYTARTPSFNYRKQLNDLVKGAPEVFIGSRSTYEFTNVVTTITDPWNRVVSVPGRRWSPWLALSECLWLVAGRNDVATLLPYNKRITQWSDDGETMYGAYGYRLKDQIPDLITRLKKDPNDRRCVLTIWNDADLTAETADPPCNDIIMFKIRFGRLNMLVVNRSNDLHWGLYAVNLPQFSFLQELLARQMGVSIGEQVHISNSLHIYNEGPAVGITQGMVKANGKRIQPLPASGPLIWHDENPSWGDLVVAANKVLEGGATTGLCFFDFAADFLRSYRDNNFTLVARNSEAYPDWVIAGRRYFDE